MRRSSCIAAAASRSSRSRRRSAWRRSGSRGDCYDNAVAESFFATLKKERIHGRSWPTKPELRTEVFEYIEVFFNRRRRHATLGMLSPADYEQSTLRPDKASLAASRLASTNKIMFTESTTTKAA